MLTDVQTLGLLLSCGAVSAIVSILTVGVLMGAKRGAELSGEDDRQ